MSNMCGCISLSVIASNHNKHILRGVELHHKLHLTRSLRLKYFRILVCSRRLTRLNSLPAINSSTMFAFLELGFRSFKACFSKDDKVISSSRNQVGLVIPSESPASSTHALLPQCTLSKD